MSRDNPSITFFIATLGRSTLLNTLHSLFGQFGFGVDCIKVFVDGPPQVDMTIFNDISTMYNDISPGSLEFIYLPENLGYWGHAIRNKYQCEFNTDYIHHADDDDIYSPHIIPQVRSDLKSNYSKLVMYKFKNSGGGIIGNKKKIIHGDVGTPSGLIPNNPKIMGEWGLFHGGDFAFYENTQRKIGKSGIVYIDRLIYICRPHLSSS